MDQNPTNANGAENQSGGGMFQDPQSRRKFLRAAVVTSATVATVGVAGAAAASASPQLFRQLRGEPVSASGTDPCVMCFEKSQGFTAISSFTVDTNGNTQPGSFFVWYTGHDLPPGNYTYTLTVSPPSATVNNASTPFRFNTWNSNGNSVYAFQVARNTGASCPTADPPNPTSGHDYNDVFPFALTGAVNSDLQVRIHVTWVGGTIASATQYTFTGTLTNVNTQAACTAHITVTANPPSK